MTETLQTDQDAVREDAPENAVVAETPVEAKDAAQIQTELAEEFLVDQATDEVLRLNLEKFEGPFEVLLYLIRSQEIDIFDIPIARITEQYLRFLEILREENLDVAGDFIVMAATLIQIKSKMILPIEVDDDEEEFEEEDPRIELVEKLLEYRKFRQVAKFLSSLEEARSDWFARNAKPKVEADPNEDEELLEVGLYDLIKAFKGVLRYISDDLTHTIDGENYSVDDKITEIQERLEEVESLAWMELFGHGRTKLEVVCYFLAILELCRMNRIRAFQKDAFSEIRIFLRKEDPSDAEVVEA